jgi:predicted dehydrogenase
LRDDVSAVPWLDEVDAVVVATTPFTHAQIISSAIEGPNTSSPKSRSR